MCRCRFSTRAGLPCVQLRVRTLPAFIASHGICATRDRKARPLVEIGGAEAGHKVRRLCREPTRHVDVVGGTRHDAKFEVVLDPELHVDPADLQKQFEVARELRDMQTSVNSMLARVAVAPELKSRGSPAKRRLFSHDQRICVRKPVQG